MSRELYYHPLSDRALHQAAVLASLTGAALQGYGPDLRPDLISRAFAFADAVLAEYKKQKEPQDEPKEETGETLSP